MRVTNDFLCEMFNLLDSEVVFNGINYRTRLEVDKVKLMVGFDFSVSPSPLGTKMGFELGWNLRVWGRGVTKFPLSYRKSLK